MEARHRAIVSARRGRFRDALNELSQVSQAGSEDQIVLAELYYQTGQLDIAEETAVSAYRTSRNGKAENARLLEVLGAIAIDRDQLQRSVHFLQRSAALAKKLGDVQQACRSLLRLLPALVDLAGRQAAAVCAAETRRWVLRSGDPELLIWLHLRFAQLEAQIGNIEIAKRHLELARSQLDFIDNAWLEGNYYLDSSAVAFLSADFCNALSLSESALKASRSSGHLRTELAAKLNLGQLWVLLGNYAEAELALSNKEHRIRPFRTLELARIDSLAQLRLATSDFGGCAELLASIGTDSSWAQRSWYSLATYPTRIRLALRTGRLAEAVDLADAGITAARARDDRLASVVFHGLRADALVEQGRLEEAGTTLALALQHADGASTAQLADLERVAGKILAREGRHDEAAPHFDRALRLLSGIGYVSAHRDVGAERDRELPPAGDAAPAAGDAAWVTGSAPVARVEELAGLIDLGSQPELLGREAIGLLASSRCIRGAALLSAADEALPDTILAVGRPQPPSEDPCAYVIELGTVRSRTISLVVTPRPGLAAQSAALAVRKLLDTVVALEHARRLEKERASLWPQDEDGDADRGVFLSPASLEVLATAHRIAPTDLPLLITGETGTGKEVLAREIHRRSSRAAKPFVPFNCTAVPRDMLDSQLFGYRRGAFTGANEAFPGVIRGAHGGTLFLDEIGELGADVQPKLLRFLETREIHPLGEAAPLPVDVRIIAATNAPLDALLTDGRFREDLYYRLNVVRLHLLPLRERREEIPALLQHFISRSCRETRKAEPRLSDETLEYLLLYKWPGNVRQLANEVHRIVALCAPGAVVTPQMLSQEIRQARRTIEAGPTAGLHELTLRINQPLESAIQQLERVMISHAMSASGGRVEKAAQILGISRKGLFLKRRRFGLVN